MVKICGLAISTAWCRGIGEDGFEIVLCYTQGSEQYILLASGFDFD